MHRPRRILVAALAATAAASGALTSSASADVAGWTLQECKNGPIARGKVFRRTDGPNPRVVIKRGKCVRGPIKYFLNQARFLRVLFREDVTGWPVITGRTFNREMENALAQWMIAYHPRYFPPRLAVVQVDRVSIDGMIRHCKDWKAPLGLESPACSHVDP